MAYQPPRDLQLVYDPDRGYYHFVLYCEPPGEPGSGLNAGRSLTITKTVDGKKAGPTSPYTMEWVGRLVTCAPSALHVALAGDKDAPNLWHPCVYTDPSSPVTVGDGGCLCWQTFHDPVTWMPVAAQHYRTVQGYHEHWTYYTYAPLGLIEGERLATLIIDADGREIWMRTQDGTLHFLPEAQDAGYTTGYSGSGPTELARMIEKIVRSDGYDVTPGTPQELPNRKVLAWTSSEAAKRVQELTLDQLKRLCRTGLVA